MAGQLLAKIAVEKAAYHFDKLYDYLVPEAYRDKVRPGCRVTVPFGAGNRRRQGVVLALEEAGEGADLSRLKPFALLLDDGAALGPELLELAGWLRENTFCTWFDAVRTLLPPGLGYRLDLTLRTAPEPPGDPDALADDMRALFSFVRGRGRVSRGRLCEAFGLLPDAPALEALLAGGWLLGEESARRKIGDDTVTMARLTPDAEDRIGELKLTVKQRAVVELLQSAGTASVREIGYFTGTTRAVAAALGQKGLVEFFKAPPPRAPLADGDAPPPPLALTGGQQRAYEGLSALYRQGEAAVSLLYGVTGSGKTSVYLRLIEDVVADGRQVIVLVPEISLTPQTIGAFTARFGPRVAILHSALSMGERLEQWKRIRAGEVSIAVGTRSAVFAPFENIGLILIDEEQESAYKSESSPRYHAREVAKHRILRHSAQLVLCSATPSVESYYHAMTGRYRLFTLTERFGHALLPEVEVVDMDGELREGNLSGVSHALGTAIAENLADGRQTILLLNRRGYNTLVKCQNCNTAVTCPHCSIGLVYHQANGRLMCHYCGYSRALAQRCEVCGSDYVKYAGEGTQRLEKELHTLFPSARVLRMDADTTMAKHAYEQRFERFAQGDYDIMVGTQMVAKGLNFPNVTLVGVLAADSTLFGDNFKSEERTFSLLTQVVGRSGRGSLHGRAYIQTHFPENEIFRLAARQDYEGFYQREIATRRLMLYPPFCTLCAVGFTGLEEGAVRAGAQAFLRELTRTARQDYPALPLRVLGPTPGVVPKVGGKYRYKLIIKCKNTRDFRAMLAQVLIWFGRRPEGRKVSAYADLYFDGSL
ncbi:replication restart helicase PriA [Ligaoa zhengdingensis]|uniref:replication restart helicase PriA n=2 Tax=Ligaoa zhengdingensis TaxID=2763658 RepID=UPI0031BB61C5